MQPAEREKKTRPDTTHPRVTQTHGTARILTERLMSSTAKVIPSTPPALHSYLLNQRGLADCYGVMKYWPGTWQFSRTAEKHERGLEETVPFSYTVIPVCSLPIHRNAPLAIYLDDSTYFRPRYQGSLMELSILRENSRLQGEIIG